MVHATCGLCGEPMPPGEEMFKYHGYSGPCPKPPLPDKLQSGSFNQRLAALLNEHSCENGSNTPDFILASYLSQCLVTFECAVNERERWYGRSKDHSELVQHAESERDESLHRD